MAFTEAVTGVDTRTAVDDVILGIVPAAATFAAAFASTGPLGPTNSFPTPGQSSGLSVSGIITSIFGCSDMIGLILLMIFPSPCL